MRTITASLRVCGGGVGDVEDVARAALAAVGGRVDHLAVEVHRRRPAAVEVVRGGGAEVDHDVGELGEGDAFAVPGLASVDDDEDEVVLVDDADGRARLVALNGMVAEV